MEDKIFDTIVISGGALKGFALLGALQCLVDQNKLVHVKKFIGTSIGAMISYLMCIGYTPIEIMVHLCKNDWMKKMANFDILKAVNGGGALSFSIINELLEKMTIEKIGKFVTLGEIHKTYGKQLICCAFIMTKQEKNEVIANLMDAGKKFSGKLISKEWEDNWLKLDIEVYLND